ncbi:hypothetical protein [Hyphococcus sp.]|uniref:hypothetical protein n=1 Tax=Hyphococcus sp. TaxID=2038636 RepID=UPI0037522774
MKLLSALVLGLAAVSAPAWATVSSTTEQTNAEQAKSPPARPNVVAQIEAMKRLAPITGKWEGEGWILNQGNRYDFRQTEHVRYNLDGAVLLIDGRGYSAGAPDGAPPMFSAFAVINYDDRSVAFSFRSYTGGQVNDFPARIMADGGFEWDAGSTRYRIWVRDDGKWFETGESKSGDDWTQFFEMNLSKVE